ncbi:MAG: sigma-54-dependent Fis family transcriptional regulator [Bacteroidetes bacterium]|nr:sigma-54-dependent Fis family transcriptional regulator [Bacteroidota bacterium]MCW5896461.1 sigma-54-dependent Fis family transcriptional regulator [Bacteroidota bacterium]
MPAKPSVLLVDDEQNILKTVAIGLEAVGFDVNAFSEPLKALDTIREQPFDIAFFDLKMSPIDGMELLREMRRLQPAATVVLMTAHGSIDSAVEAIKLGAYDYLQKPFEFSELKLFARKVLDHHSLRREVMELKEELSRAKSSGEIVTRSERMRSMLDLGLQVASGNIAVLIEGESGTGKELLAHFIHENSPRREKPFVVVNCAALAEQLLESELFGHVKGAFTGATKDREGRFEAADGGTVFLDEIGEVPLQTQVKLLRFLQSKEFERVGETESLKVDVRVIAATNKNIEEAVKSGTFREDLFYRLNAVTLKLPPLRERMEDIPLLVTNFLRKSGSSSEISKDAFLALKSYSWKGNVRELENVIERAVLLAREGDIRLEHLPDQFRELGVSSSALMSLEEVERLHIMKVLRIAHDLEEAASILNIDPATLWRKRKKFQL